MITFIFVVVMSRLFFYFLNRYYEHVDGLDHEDVQLPQENFSSFM